MHKLAVYYDEVDQFGKRVRGHKARAMAFVEEWDRHYPDSHRIIEHPTWHHDDEILLCDSWQQWDHMSGKTITIVDGKMTIADPWVIIDHHFPSKNKTYARYYHMLFHGPKYFLRGDIFNTVYCNKQKRDTIVFVPGGNSDRFWSEVYGETSSISQIVGLIDLAKWHIVIAEHFTAYGFAELITCKAALVITAASTSMLEALSVDVPVLAVQTTDEIAQIDNIQGIEQHNLGRQYSLSNLEQWLQGDVIFENGSDHVASDGTQFVVSEIIKELER